MIGKPQMIRLVNQEIIENYVRQHGPVSRPDIAKATGLSLVTVNKVVETLLKDERIKPCGLEDSCNSGRKPMLYEINDALYSYLIVFIDQEKCHISIINHKGMSTYQTSFDFTESRSGGFVSLLLKQLRKVLSDFHDKPFKEIYLGVPGVVRNGVVESIPRIPELENMDLAHFLEKEFKLKVYVENDVNLSTLGYWKDSTKSSRPRTFLYLNKGVRMGVNIGETFYKGSTCLAGEIGSIRLFSLNESVTNTFEEVIEQLTHEMENCSDREKHQKLHSQFLTCITDLLLVIQTTTDPIEVVLNHRLLVEEDLLELRRRLVHLIGNDHSPKLVLLHEELGQIGLKGTIRYALEFNHERYITL